MYEPTDKGVSIREPSTANFYIDADDRLETTFPSPAQFTINQKQSLFNGFFTRMAVQEIVMNWAVPNISATLGNNTLRWYATATPGTIFTATVPDGNYTVENLLKTLAPLMTTAQSGSTWTANAPSTSSSTAYLGKTGATAVILQGGTTTTGAPSIQVMLNLTTNATGYTTFPVQSPCLQPFSYIDFICQDITYNQSLKDGSTNSIVPNRDVLYRWCFAWDDTPTRDGYNYPILQGYEPFHQRRCIAFPKQVKWQPNMPVGQLKFEVYDTYNNLMTYLDAIGNGNEGMSFRMTLLVSEV
jgi:hypothetical protein